MERGTTLDLPLSSVQWPPYCCVPAFLCRSVISLMGDPDILLTDDVCKDIAVAVGVVVGPHTPNPWGLRVSISREDWGVGSDRIPSGLELVGAILGCSKKLVFETVPLNTIAFQLYEDCITEISRPGAVVGISFDYAALRVGPTADSTGDLTRHVVRLTPLVGDEGKEPNILSQAFGFEYAGRLWIFDDAGELRGSEAFLSWRALTRASRTGKGGFWIVRSDTKHPVKRSPEQEGSADLP